MIIYREVNILKVYIHKQVQKYMKNLDAPTRKKVENAIEGLREGKGDIIKLKGKNMFRLKIPPYRVGFTLDYANNIIEIILIRPRGDFYKHI